jgi:hypothetical protein
VHRFTIGRQYSSIEDIYIVIDERTTDTLSSNVGQGFIFYE